MQNPCNVQCAMQRKRTMAKQKQVSASAESHGLRRANGISRACVRLLLSQWLRIDVCVDAKITIWMAKNYVKTNQFPSQFFFISKHRNRPIPTWGQQGIIESEEKLSALGAYDWIYYWAGIAFRFTGDASTMWRVLGLFIEILSVKKKTRNRFLSHSRHCYFSNRFSFAWHNLGALDRCVCACVWVGGLHKMHRSTRAEHNDGCSSTNGDASHILYFITE